RTMGTLQDQDMIRPVEAEIEEIRRIHTDEYIRTVLALSSPSPSPEAIRMAEQYGLDEGDTPFFEDMHRSAAAIVGGSIEACEQVMSGRALRAVHLAGGLHHAMNNKAGGFCVYNDASCAIAAIRE